ncbi:VOC family protein [Micromonospora sp. NPDC003197]
MSRSIVFIVYVNDAPAAARFYGDLLQMKPDFETPGYISFKLGSGADLALWGGQFDGLTPAVPRTSEVWLALPGGSDEIDQTYREWQAKGVKVLQEPVDAVFGRTFVVADPDGNRIRVAPQG